MAAEPPSQGPGPGPFQPVPTPAESLFELGDTLRADTLAALAETLGAERLARITAALPQPPASCCVRVNTTRASPAAVLAQLREALAGFDTAGAAVHPALPDAIIVPAAALEGPPPQFDPSMPELILGRLCGEAVLRGSHVYVKGVLAASRGINPGDVVQLTAAMDGYRTVRGARADEFDGRRVFVGLGVSAHGRSALFAAESGLAARVTRRVTAELPPLNGVLPGLIFPQNLPSLAVAHVLAPQPGERVLDMCAAPGGKTTHIAQLMGDSGLVVGCDRSRNKAQRVASAAASLELRCVVAIKADSTGLVDEAADPDPAAVVAGARPGKALGGVRGFAPASFDRVLLDGPCSALGLRPRLQHDTSPEDLAGTALYQRQFIRAAARLVRPGGVLVYSTCTFNPGENEANVAFALEACPWLRLEAGDVRIGGPGVPGAGLTPEQCELVQRFDPGSEPDAIGFFCARFRSVAGADPPPVPIPIPEAN